MKFDGYKAFQFIGSNFDLNILLRALYDYILDPHFIYVKYDYCLFLFCESHNDDGMINWEPNFRKASNCLSCSRRSNRCTGKPVSYCCPSSFHKGHNCPFCFQTSSCCKGGLEPCCSPSICRNCSSCLFCCRRNSCCTAWL